MKQPVDEMHRELSTLRPLPIGQNVGTAGVYSQSSESNKTATVVSLALLSESGLKPA